MPSTDLIRTWKFYRYFGFETVGLEPSNEDDWLRLKRRDVEVDFYPDEIDFTHDDFIRFGHVCLIRVDDVSAWHEAFARSPISWKARNPSMTRLRDDLWGGSPSFSLTDRDGNLIWCVQSEKG